MNNSSKTPERRGPLSGVTVLDLSSHIMGPYSTQMMGDMGADVLMVEPPAGSKSRLMGQCAHTDLSPIGLNLFRNKRSLSIDLKSAEGREAILEIAKKFDVIVTNLRTGPLGRLGLSYEQVAESNPRVIYCHAVGFSPSSGRSNDPAYDDIIQAECGLADAAMRINGTPTLAPTIMADKICGMMVANAVIAALYHREQSGEDRGQYIRLAMLDVMRAFTMLEHGAGAMAVPPISEPGYTRVLSSARGPARTADGWINMMPYSQREYDAIFAHGGRHDLVGSDKSAGRNVQIEADFLYREMRAIIAMRPTQHWLDFCKEHSIAVGRIVSLDEIVREFPVRHHPHLGDFREIPYPVSFSDSSPEAARPAPLIGEHSFDVLRDLGWSEAQISDLQRRGLVRSPVVDALSA